jgi:hypothetical protein
MKLKKDFKKIPEFSNYCINRQGKLYNKKIGKEIKFHTSNGYIFTKIYNDNGKGVCIGLHRLLAMTFLEKPNIPEKLTVNHINGDRADNRLENLEWSTYAQNTQHAFDTDLNNFKIPVILTNSATGHRERYPSKNDFYIKNPGISKAEIEKQGNKVFHKGFIIEFITDEYDKRMKDNSYSSGVAIREVKSDKITIFSNPTEVSKILKVGCKVIRRKLRKKLNDYPINGYNVCHGDEIENLPIYTDEEKEAFSEEKFVHNPVRIIYSDGKSKLTGSVLTASKLLNLNERVVRQCLYNKLPRPDGCRIVRHTCK